MVYFDKKEYDQEIPQSHTANKSLTFADQWYAKWLFNP